MAHYLVELRGLLSAPLVDMVRELDADPEMRSRVRPHSASTRPGEQKVITLDHNTTLGDALKVLARNHILSAPVVIQPDVLDLDGIGNQASVELLEGQLQTPTLLGFFDVQDALRCLLSELKTDASSSTSVHRSVLAWMRELEQVERAVSDRKLISVLGDDAELMFKANIEGATILDAIREGFLGKKSVNGLVHRIAVFNNRGETVHVISMSDVVRYVSKNRSKLGDLLNKTIHDLGFISTDADPADLVTVGPTIPAIEAFAHMAKCHVSGVGISDDHEELIANLSASDLRHLQPEHFGMLGLPVAEYLALMHGTSYAGFSHKESKNRQNPFFSQMKEGGFRRHPPFLITCTPNDIFAKLLDLIVENKIHRVYIVSEGEAMKPLGTITLTDILRCFKTLLSE